MEFDESGAETALRGYFKPEVICILDLVPGPLSRDSSQMYCCSLHPCVPLVYVEFEHSSVVRFVECLFANLWTHLLTSSTPLIQSRQSQAPLVKISWTLGIVVLDCR